MCGIAGILNTDQRPPVDPHDLRRMAAQLTHRGPDDQGIHVDPQGHCGLAFRRLAIIDLDSGNQPLANEDQTIWLVFNGEIYNFRELRQRLIARGHAFRTQTDSEVIVHLYEEYGADCFSHLAGMFAVAIWDQNRRQLVLARDRFGKKPLVYADHDGRLYFASELKAILALPGIPRDVLPQSIHQYLLFQYVPAPHSIFRGFHKIPPGHHLTIRPGENARPDPMPYWTLPHPKPFTGSYEDAKAQLETLLLQAVRKRLVADVPLGAFLSGGIDSSLVVALMRRLGVSPLRTFSIGFTDRRYDETAHARHVADHFKTEHHQHIVTPQARDILDTLGYHYDEPFADSSAIPTYYVSHWTRKSVTVALTGDAGDECFLGYDRYQAAALAARCDVIPRPLRHAIAKLANLIPHSQAKSRRNRAYRFLSAISQPASRRYLAWINIFTPSLLLSSYRPEFAELLDFDQPLAWFDELYQTQPGSAPEKAAHTDFLSYLPYDLLTKVDIASMACSLECRSPFLDHELVTFALSLPPQWRLGPRGGKHILKDYAHDILPPSIGARPKMGFGVPIGEWFRNELRDLLSDTLLAPDALTQRIFQPQAVNSLVNQHITGRQNLAHPLWALLMLELWYRRWNPVFP